jgi:hypothetical protein
MRNVGSIKYFFEILHALNDFNLNKLFIKISQNGVYSLPITSLSIHDGQNLLVISQ